MSAREVKIPPFMEEGSLAGGLHALSVKPEPSILPAPESDVPVINSLLDRKGRPIGTFDRAMAAHVCNQDAFYGAPTAEAVAIDHIIDQTCKVEGLDDWGRLGRVSVLGFTTLAALRPEEGMREAQEFLDRPITSST